MKKQYALIIIIFLFIGCSYNPYTPYTKLNKAAYLLSKGNKTEAEQIINSALNEYKEYYTANLFYASYLHSQGKNNEANKYYEISENLYNKQHVTKWKNDKSNTSYTTAVINGIPQYWGRNVIEWVENNIELNNYQKAQRIIDNNKKNYLLTKLSSIKLLLLELRISKKINFFNYDHFLKQIEFKFNDTKKKNNVEFDLVPFYLEYYEITNNNFYLDKSNIILNETTNVGDQNKYKILRLHYYALTKNENNFNLTIKILDENFIKSVSVELYLSRLKSLLKNNDFYSRKVN